MLETIKKMQDINLFEPQAVTAADGIMMEVKKIKFSKRLDCYFLNQQRTNNEKKQVYALYYRQIDEDIKTCLAELDDWKDVYGDKNLISLLQMLQNVNFTYKSNKESICPVEAKSDFIRLRQGKHKYLQEYCERFIALKEVNEFLKNSIHEDPSLLKIIAKEHGRNLTTLSGAKREAYVKEGQERMLAMQVS